MGDSHSMSGPRPSRVAGIAPVEGTAQSEEDIEVINLEPNAASEAPILPKLTVGNSTKRSLNPSESMHQLPTSGLQRNKSFGRRRAITNEHRMQIVEAIAKRLDFPVQELAHDVKEKRDALHEREREQLIKIHDKEAVDAEIADVRRIPTMRIPFTTGMIIPDSVTAQLNGNESKKPAEDLINNIIKPYKWYEIDHVIIDSKDHKAIVDSNKKELWYLRIGFVFLIGAVIFYIVYFAIFYSEKSGSAEYEREKTNIVNGVKFGITVWMSLIMFACNKTTNARDSILANHLKTAVDVVRRVEKERWCGSHEPLALPILQRLGEARTNASRVSWTA